MSFNRDALLADRIQERAARAASDLRGGSCGPLAASTGPASAHGGAAGGSAGEQLVLAVELLEQIATLCRRASLSANFMDRAGDVVNSLSADTSSIEELIHSVGTAKKKRFSISLGSGNKVKKQFAHVLETVRSHMQRHADAVLAAELKMHQQFTSPSPGAATAAAVPGLGAGGARPTLGTGNSTPTFGSALSTPPSLPVGGSVDGGMYRPIVVAGSGGFASPKQPSTPLQGGAPQFGLAASLGGAAQGAAAAAAAARGPESSYGAIDELPHPSLAGGAQIQRPPPPAGLNAPTAIYGLLQQAPDLDWFAFFGEDCPRDAIQSWPRMLQFFKKVYNSTLSEDFSGIVIRYILDGAFAPVGSQSPGDIKGCTLDRYVTFCNAFGRPILGECDVAIKALFNLPFFVGATSALAAESLLHDRVLGSYLVRLSDTELCLPYISFVYGVDQFVHIPFTCNFPHGYRMMDEATGSEIPFSTFLKIVQQYAAVLKKPLPEAALLHMREPYFAGVLSGGHASQMLAGTEEGTFMIRFSSQPGAYASTFVDGTGAAKHSLIESLTLLDGVRFNIQGQSDSFNHMSELVEYYGDGLLNIAPALQRVLKFSDALAVLRGEKPCLILEDQQSVAPEVTPVVSAPSSTEVKIPGQPPNVQYQPMSSVPVEKEDTTPKLKIAASATGSYGTGDIRTTETSLCIGQKLEIGLEFLWVKLSESTLTITTPYSAIAVPLDANPPEATALFMKTFQFASSLLISRKAVGTGTEGPRRLALNSTADALRFHFQTDEDSPFRWRRAGVVFEGSFLDGIASGSGKYAVASTGESFEGTWDRGFRIGKGRASLPFSKDGTSRLGEVEGVWNDDRLIGPAQIVWENSPAALAEVQFDGLFANGLREGPGVSLLRSSQGRQVKLFAEWSKGSLKPCAHSSERSIVSVLFVDDKHLVSGEVTSSWNPITSVTIPSMNGFGIDDVRIGDTDLNRETRFGTFADGEMHGLVWMSLVDRGIELRALWSRGKLAISQSDAAPRLTSLPMLRRIPEISADCKQFLRQHCRSEAVDRDRTGGVLPISVTFPSRALELSEVQTLHELTCPGGCTILNASEESCFEDRWEPLVAQVRGTYGLQGGATWSAIETAVAAGPNLQSGVEGLLAETGHPYAALVSTVAQILKSHVNALRHSQSYARLVENVVSASHQLTREFLDHFQHALISSGADGSGTIDSETVATVHDVVTAKLVFLLQGVLDELIDEVAGPLFKDACSLSPQASPTLASLAQQFQFQTLQISDNVAQQLVPQVQSLAQVPLITQVVSGLITVVDTVSKLGPVGLGVADTTIVKVLAALFVLSGCTPQLVRRIELLADLFPACSVPTCYEVSVTTQRQGSIVRLARQAVAFLAEKGQTANGYC